MPYLPLPDFSCERFLTRSSYCLPPFPILQLSVISSSSIATCRLASKAFCELTTPILFRTITLRAETMLGTDDSLPSYVYFILQEDGTLGLPNEVSPDIVDMVRDHTERSKRRREIGQLL